MHTSSPADVFQDRDLAWLEFNRRVLHEADDERTPLLERVKFLAIYSTNLDEFFMKRVGLLKHHREPLGLVAGNGSQPNPQLLEIRQAILPRLAQQADVYRNAILPQLARNGIHLPGWRELSPQQAQWAEDYFRQNVFPILTPLAVDPGHPFPFMSNLSSSLGILLRNPETGERFFARVKIPGVLPQFVPLPADFTNGSSPTDRCFLRLLDLVQNNLCALFPGMEVLEVMPFRITRSAAVELGDDADDETVVEMVEDELEQRRFEQVIRLEYGPGSSPGLVKLLLDKLALTEIDGYEMTAELDFGDLFAIAGLNRPELKDQPWQPVIPSALADDDADIFALIRGGDLLVHHPYESFDATVERFIRRAAEDPKVLALKMTVYRVGADTPFLDSLIKAAAAGKEVACLVEVTASFDELQNLKIAHALEQAGVHVVYGMVGLKTHCKTTLVVRQDDDGLRCYAHVGTGNYNVKTARLYTDLGLFSCAPDLTGDVVSLFHYLTGLSRKQDYEKLLVAPVNMREQFLAMIRQEIVHQQAGRPAHIIAKINQLEDRSICEALIEASQAGVPIEMIVRGLCTLLPGIPGQTDNIRVTSIIGRFLEHSRIYYFRNGADNPLEGRFFIGSADWMQRNLSDRVEAITPVEAAALRERLWNFLQLALSDHRQAWELHSDGTYVQRQPRHSDDPHDESGLGTQQVVMDWTRSHASV